MAACSVMLAGCEHVGEGFKSFGNGVTGLFTAGGEGPTLDDPTRIKSPDDLSTAQMARYMSGGSVEVYGLDGSPAGSATDGVVSGGPALPADNGGVAYGGDSSVLVYPVDDGAMMMSAPPGMVPPSGAQPDYRSPFADHGDFLPMGGASPAAPVSQQGQPGRIYFDHGSAAIGGAGRQVIGHAAQSASGALTVDGYASTRAGAKDPVDRHIVNLKESMDRAFNVSRELIRAGVPAGAIKTCGYGDSSPAPEGEDASRRVEIRSGAGY